MTDSKDTRKEIVEAADDLFYRRGFTETSFADIAAAVGIARGNFYYHFKSKDAILDAVLEKRLQDRRMWLEAWESETDDPAARIRKFIDILIMNQDKIIEFGCPLGSMSLELSKLDHSGVKGAAQLFTLFRQWLKAQFATLGFAGRSDGLAMQVLADSQGVAVMGNAFRDADFMNEQVRRIHCWLDDQMQTLK